MVDNQKKGYELDEDIPVEVCEDPFGERTIYNVEKTTFKNLRKNEKLIENDLFD